MPTAIWNNKILNGTPCIRFLQILFHLWGLALLWNLFSQLEINFLSIELAILTAKYNKSLIRDEVQTILGAEKIVNDTIMSIKISVKMNMNNFLLNLV